MVMSQAAHTFYATLEPDEARTAELDAAKLSAALRAFFRIMELWQVNSDDARVLLGQPGRSTFFKWKKEGAGSLPHDVVRRISYVLGIYKTLQIIFQQPGQADAWVRKPNAAFGGRTALEHMLGGDVTDLALVRRTLDAVRGLGA